ncbi:putative ribonuclease H-like domain-containing protein, partial [Tanacetum coccineum]
FDVDSLTISINYVPVVTGNQTNGIAGTKDNIIAGQAKKKTEPEQEYILIPFCTTNPLISQGPKDNEEDVGMNPTEVNESGAFDKGEEDEQDTRSEFERLLQQEKQTNNTNSFNIVGTPVSAIGPSFTNDDPSSPVNVAEASNAIEADLNNLETTMNVGFIPTTRINKDHPIELIIGDLHSASLTRRMSQQNLEEHCLVSYINKQRRINHKDYQNCLFALGMATGQTLVDLPNGKRVIGTTWVFRNKKDKRGIVVRNKARLMDVKSAFLYGTIEEGVYVCQPPDFKDPHFPDKVYKVEKALFGLHQAPRAWYETLSTYLLGNGFRKGTIDKTLFIKKEKSDILLVQVYVDDIIFGSTKKSLCDEFEGLMHKRFQMSSMGELTFFLGLQIQQNEGGIFISQDKYVAEILKKFDFAIVKTASTPIETNKALVKDEEAEAADVHLYRSMIGSLMYLTASGPDIMFAVCACARFQVILKTSHIYAVKRIFRYLKGQPKLGLWYPRDSPFDLEAFSDSDYARASLDRKSTTRGCQFLGRRLILWQCKKQTIVANSTTEAEYVAASNCCGQVLWIQNQMLDYGFNFMNTKIYIDNKSTICIVK